MRAYGTRGRKRTICELLIQPPKFESQKALCLWLHVIFQLVYYFPESVDEEFPMPGQAKVCLGAKVRGDSPLPYLYSLGPSHLGKLSRCVIRILHRGNLCLTEQIFLLLSFNKE